MRVHHLAQSAIHASAILDFFGGLAPSDIANLVVMLVK